MPSQAERLPSTNSAGTPLPYGPVVTLEVERRHAGRVERVQGFVAEEVPVCMMLNDEPYSVMMLSPQDIPDFVLGFCLTEGILSSSHQLLNVRVDRHPEGLVANCTVPRDCAEALLARQRNLTSRTGCGLCGVRNLADAVRTPGKVGAGVAVASGAIARAHRDLCCCQAFNQQTGAVHAAGWADVDGRVLHVREDVGRHNALDKLIGHLARTGFNANDGFCVITSRASYEMVVKAATVGMTLLAAVSAPTALAVRMARDTNLTLAGFVRGNDLVLYSHPERVGTNEERS